MVVTLAARHTALLSAASASSEQQHETATKAYPKRFLFQVRDTFTTDRAVSSEAATAWVTMMLGLWLLMPFNSMEVFGAFDSALEWGRQLTGGYDGEIAWGVLFAAIGAGHFLACVSGWIAYARIGSMLSGMLWSCLFTAVALTDLKSLWTPVLFHIVAWCYWHFVKWRLAQYRTLFERDGEPFIWL